MTGISAIPLKHLSTRHGFVTNFSIHNSSEGNMNSLPVAIFLVSFLATVSEPVYPGILFQDDFSSGLDKWTGINQGSHGGIIVDDPINSGHGSVLTFNRTISGGDIFSVISFDPSNTKSVSFDYIGIPKTGSTPNVFGGYFGIAPQYNANGGYAYNWLASTDNLTFFHLIDDGLWHTVTINVGQYANGFSQFHLMMEDSTGVPGDSYFDNFRVVDFSENVPEPDSLVLFLLGAFLMYSISRKLEKARLR